MEDHHEDARTARAAEAFGETEADGEGRRKIMDMDEMDKKAGRGEGRAPSPFETAVMLAYRTEHGDEKKKDVAARIGISLSALSQHFAAGRNFKRETLDRFLAPIAAESLRRAVLAAYDGGAFAKDPADDPGRPLPERVTALAHGNRPDLALPPRHGGLDACEDDAERWTLSLLALKLCFRLDLPGEGMRVASLLKAWGEEAGRPELVAAALAASARAMRRTVLFTAREIQDERQRSAALLSGLSGLSGQRLEAAAFARELLLSESVVDVIQAHDARGGEAEALRGHLARIAKRRAASARSRPALARAWQTEARVRLALGELGAAEEAIGEALKAGGNDLTARLECGRLQGRLLAERGEVKEALELLRRMADICGRDRHVYLQRLAQTEIARIERPRVNGA